jgi:pyruvate/2-oxoglutarate dehydrogenase complex dihydrolipoamide dehydrogenase (E3) component
VIDAFTSPNESLGAIFLILGYLLYMQGYGVSMKTGLTYRQLTETVGIHPTSSEEIVTLSITKSSGEDAAAGGC